MKPTALLAACVALTAARTFAAIPTVSGVTVAQDPITRIVTVSYTLTGADAIVTADVRTNGVSIGAKHVRRTWGDVNRLITADNAAVHTFCWAAGHDWPGYAVTNASLTIDVLAHPRSNPPRYMAICLAAPGAPTYFYDSSDALPEDITASRWKTEWLLMRKIDAAGIPWRMGAPRNETETFTAHESKDSQTWRLRHEPAHVVTLTNDYYIGVYPVTQRQYFLAFSLLEPNTPSTGALQKLPQPSTWSGRPDSDLRPVENVQWHTLRGDGGMAADGDAADDKPYNWPNKGHAVNPNYLLGKMRARFNVAFDLPTEAQWEYACRAGCTDSDYDWNADIDELAWTTNNSAVVENGVPVWQTHPVGLKKPNAFGLYDMLGNVQEWVLDFLSIYKSENVDGVPILEPVGPWHIKETNGHRSRKGGSFLDLYCRCAESCAPIYSQNANSQFIGFRLCAPARLD